MNLRIALSAGVMGAATMLAATGAARAEAGGVVLCKAALADPIVAAGCVGVGLVASELLAERPFGLSGEIMKVVVAPVKIIDGNIKAAPAESGEIDKVVRATTGISFKAIKENGGVFGGGLSGGENSIFRHNLGIRF